MLYTDLLSKANENYQNNQPFVIFRKPNSCEVFLLEQTNTELYYFDENSQENGFLLVPFCNEKSVFLKSEKIYSVIYKEEKTEINNSKISLNEKGRENYCQKIKNTIDYIQTGEVKKIVFSRCLDIELQTFVIGELFHRMINRYSSAFCYIFHHPKIGTWGASTPETLVKIQGNHIHTMALAGTQPYSKNVSWTQKEIDEQQIVTDTIVKQLKDNVKELNISKTQTVKAGNLAHLCTQIQGKINDEKSIFSIINKLHPTPAVCGFPTQKAKEYILENEGYDRAYYSGYCGTIFYENKFPTLDLFVNLRCMQLFENHARLYVGGGITKDSIPENEWQETQNKAQTMLDII